MASPYIRIVEFSKPGAQLDSITKHLLRRSLYRISRAAKSRPRALVAAIATVSKSSGLKDNSLQKLYPLV